MMYRLVPEWCSPESLDTILSIDDVMIGNAIMDMRAYYANRSNPTPPGQG